MNKILKLYLKLLTVTDFIPFDILLCNFQINFKYFSSEFVEKLTLNETLI